MCVMSTQVSLYFLGTRLYNTFFNSDITFCIYGFCMIPTVNSYHILNSINKLSFVMVKCYFFSAEVVNE
jgi:hypothetical protein